MSDLSPRTHLLKSTFDMLRSAQDAIRERSVNPPKRPISGRFYLFFIQLALTFAAVLYWPAMLTGSVSH